MQDIHAHVASVCRAAKEASRGFGSTSTAKKNALLCAMADQLTADCATILAANAEDLAAAAENGVPKTMLDRLKLDEKRVFFDKLESLQCSKTIFQFQLKCILKVAIALITQCRSKPDHSRLADTGYCRKVKRTHKGSFI